jgi:hypothetical protein
MNVEYKDFIGFYRNVFPKGYCQHMVTEFDRLSSSGAGSNRQVSEKAYKHYKDDEQVFLYLKNTGMIDFDGNNPCNIFFDGLQNCYDRYSAEYSTLMSSGNIRSTDLKLQRTQPGGGYHVWHHEQGGDLCSNRVVTYMLYLNTFTPEQAGETEFLYQQTRVRPEENLMLLWPASYTHCHRGNPVYGSGYKYVATGWFYYN